MTIILTREAYITGCTSCPVCSLWRLVTSALDIEVSGIMARRAVVPHFSPHRIRAWPYFSFGKRTSVHEASALNPVWDKLREEGYLPHLIISNYPAFRYVSNNGGASLF